MIAELKRDVVSLRWEKEVDPTEMLDLLYRENIYNNRKGRLFAIACCRRVKDILDTPKLVKNLEVAELMAEGIKLSNIHTKIIDEAIKSRNRMYYKLWRTSYAATLCTSLHIDPFEVAYNTSNRPSKKITKERAIQANLIREIWGNPFNRNYLLDNDDYKIAISRWLTPDVINLTNCAISERLGDYTLNPIILGNLSDALEEAGCDRIDILEHLRKDVVPNVNSHVKGCWVLDLLLEKK